ncbi:MAG: ATP-binding protein, partial [Chloroflexota bacterium]
FDVIQLESVVKRIGDDMAIKSLDVAGTNKLEPVRLKLSEEAVEAILWEVLENAKKFHPEGEPSVQIFAFLMKSREVGIWIGDNGLTLSPEQLAQVWTPYYQGEKAFTGEISGMGLGLPMVASLIWGVGGRCRMYNRPGEAGVIVEMIVPVEEDGAVPAETRQNRRQPTAAD